MAPLMREHVSFPRIVAVSFKLSLCSLLFLLHSRWQLLQSFSSGWNLLIPLFHQVIWIKQPSLRESEINCRRQGWGKYSQAPMASFLSFVVNPINTLLSLLPSLIRAYATSSFYPGWPCSDTFYRHYIIKARLPTVPQSRQCPCLLFKLTCCLI